MSFLIKTAKKIRYHWKKSTFAVIVFSYGYGYLREYLETQNLIKNYCEKAVKIGRLPITNQDKPKTITVILNPNANKRSAVDDFEKYCAPILHLAGILVNIIKTESEGHAKKLVQEINNTDAIVVAGGDGTLSEVVTGLLRRTDENTSGLVPLGVLPLGQNNSFASNLFPGGSRIAKAKSLVDATMAIVEERTKAVDVMRVEITNSNEDIKPVYALSGLKWGAFRDAEARKDKYWYYGSLRKYATYVFNGYKDDLTWNINTNINYTPPCSGCLNCAVKINNNVEEKWFNRFKKKSINSNENLNKLNPECSIKHQKQIQTSDLELTTLNYFKNETPALHLSVGPKVEAYMEFVKNGWKYQTSQEKPIVDKLNARQVELNPNEDTLNNKE